jgi:hypothetical protein
MYFFRTTIIAVFLFLFFAFNAKAVNDTLTIGQAFDWKVGDTLVYRTFTWMDAGPPYGTVYSYSGNHGFAVNNRNNLSDTIVYHITWSSGNTDTLILSQLDSLITKFSYSILYPYFGGCQDLQGMPSSDSSWAHGSFNSFQPAPIDSLASNNILYPCCHGGWNILFTEKIGVRYADFGSLDFWPSGQEGGCGIKLVYYKSDSVRWIDPDFYTSIPEPSPALSFHLFPNPATDGIIVSAQNQYPINISIYDIAGKCLRTVQTTSDGSLSIHIGDFPSGYYLLKVTDQNLLSASKGFVIAR